jgi:hypothetical protein
MSECFAAQSLVETRTSKDGRRLELTFVDIGGEKRTISLPVGVAADLAPVLTALVERTANAGSAKFTKMPKRWAVGTARHERLVLLQFDDDPPYGLDLEVAETLWREVREGQQTISRQGAPALQ